MDIVQKTLAKGEVQLVGFGTFEVKKRAARIGRNPRTKEEIKIPASKHQYLKLERILKNQLTNKNVHSRTTSGH